MRRGLIEWSKAELPDAVFERRLAALRGALAHDRIDALVAYTNFTQTAAVSWLSGFVPYWSETALIVPREGSLVLVTAATPRGRPWFEATAKVDEIIFAPKIAAGTAERLRAMLPANATLGVIGLADIPAALGRALHDLGVKLVDATVLLESVRSSHDAAGAALARTAAAIAQRALGTLTPDDDALDAAAAVAAVERSARRSGAEEVYIAVAPDLARDRRLVRLEGEASLGPAFAVRASVAYKGAWVRMTRTVVRADSAPVVAAVDRLAAAVAGLPALDGFAAFDAWLVEGAQGMQPLSPLAGSALPGASAIAENALVSVQVTLMRNGLPIIVGAPALTGDALSAGAFLVAPVFGEAR